MNRYDRLRWEAASILTLFVLWGLSAFAFPSVIPSISETAAALLEAVTTDGPYNNPFYYHVWMTAEMIFISLFISLIAGTILGVTLGTTRLENAASSWVYGWLAVPSLVIVFISAIWLGFNVRAGYFAVPVVITPFVALNMWEGARNLDGQLDEMATFFGASRYRTFTDIILPQLIPFLFASIRSSLSVGWKITLLVETFLLNRGVGFMFKYYFDQYDLTRMTSWLIIFVIFLIVIEYSVIAPLHRRLTHWRPDVEGARIAK